MADNETVKNASGAAFTASLDELSDSSKSPKVTLLTGDGTASPYRIDTAFSTLGTKLDTVGTKLDTVGTKLDTIHADLATTLHDDLANTLATYLAQIKSWGFDVAVTPTVTNGAYSAGDIMGALMTFGVARLADEEFVITGAQIASKAAVTPNLTLYLFNADPTSTTKTDNAAYSLAAADVFKCIAVIPFGTGWTDHGTPNTIQVDGLSIVATPATGTVNVFGLLVDGTGVTLGSTSDIQVRLRGVGV